MHIYIYIYTSPVQQTKSSSSIDHSSLAPHGLVPDHHDRLRQSGFEQKSNHSTSGGSEQFWCNISMQKKNIKLRSVIVLAGYFFLLQDPYVTVTKNTHTWIVLLAILRYLINIKSPKYERNRKPISVSQCAHGEKILENLTAQRSLRSSNMLNLGSSAKYIHVQYYIQYLSLSLNIYTTSNM